jgi:Homeodomain-like domain
MKEHIVRLTDEGRERLQELCQAGTRSVRVVQRAQILLKSDAGLIDKDIAAHVGCNERRVREVRKRFCTGGLERAVYEAPRSGRPPSFTVRQQQQVVALACTDPPEGRTRWTLELLCKHAVRRGFVRTLSKSEIALWLRAHDLKPWRKKHGAFPSLPPSSASAWKTFSTSTRSHAVLRNP